MLRSALRTAEQTWTARITARLDEPTRGRLPALMAIPDDDGGTDPCEDGEPETLSMMGSIMSEPGNVSLESMMTEVRKLEQVRAVGLPPALSADVAPRVAEGWRVRAVVEAPSHLRRHPQTLTIMHTGR